MSKLTEMEVFYGKRGIFKPGSWKYDSDRLFTPHYHAVAVFDNLRLYGYVPAPDKPFTFLSTSASNGSHEFAMWLSDSTLRQAGNLFVASDLLEHNLLPEEASQTQRSHKFRSLRADGAHLPFLDASVDMIWDRKGCLWHAADSPGFAAEAELEDLIKEYKRVLKPGGSIVIDNNPKFTDPPSISGFCKSIIAGLMYDAGLPAIFRPEQLYNGTASQYEPSTVAMINKSYPVFWKTIRPDFDITNLGKNELRVRVMSLREGVNETTVE